MASGLYIFYQLLTRLFHLKKSCSSDNLVILYRGGGEWETGVFAFIFLIFSKISGIKIGQVAKFS